MQNITLLSSRFTNAARPLLVPLLLLLPLLLAGCAASRSPVTGLYELPATKNTGAEKVSVAFHFRHLTQEHGLDASPKLQNQGVKDFDNIFRNALGEISNISRYDTFTEAPNDVNVPNRRIELEKIRSDHGYTMNIDVLEESSFKEKSLSGIITLCSLTLIPMPNTWDYTFTVNVAGRDGRVIRTYQRKASVANWTQVILMFFYPFHPLEGKREAVYQEALQDIFRQIEAERILK